jgi:hypothetical protein
LAVQQVLGAAQDVGSFVIGQGDDVAAGGDEVGYAPVVKAVSPGEVSSFERTEGFVDGWIVAAMSCSVFWCMMSLRGGDPIDALVADVPDQAKLTARPYYTGDLN